MKSVKPRTGFIYDPIWYAYVSEERGELPKEPGLI
jgi:hypothetical protein